MLRRPVSFITFFFMSAGAAFASDTPVESVEVTMDLAAIENTEAAAFWADLETDLGSAIISRVSDRLADEGSAISIDIDELSMSNSFAAALGNDSVLAGSVEIRNAGDETKNGFFDLSVTVDQAGAVDSDGSVRNVAVEQAYQRLIDTYAATVVDRMR